eukprot:Lithocolla_globosa_v1_NODE_2436_length_2008_cov_8.986175.p1 type:complete len:125 gc:universal NODE_2436_length_2008_cov_8.986175:571-197(-)
MKLVIFKTGVNFFFGGGTLFFGGGTLFFFGGMKTRSQNKKMTVEQENRLRKAIPQGLELLVTEHEELAGVYYYGVDNENEQLTNQQIQKIIAALPTGWVVDPDCLDPLTIVNPTVEAKLTENSE